MKYNQILFLRLYLIALPSFLLVISIFLLSNTYETFTFFIFNQFDQLDKLEKFRTTLLTRERFVLLRILVITSTLIIFSLVLYLWKRANTIPVWWNNLIKYCKNLFYRIMQFWQAIPASERAVVSILLLCVVITRLYFLSRFPFHIDERFSYLYFVSKGVGVSMAYYPNPNNHILYTLFCNVARLFLSQPVLIMKVPSFLFGICLTLLFWGVARYYFDSYTALLAAAFFSFSDQVFYYAVQGRGYTLLLIFTLIAIVSVLRIINNQQLRLSSYLWLWLSATLGFYTIPIFLYPFCGLIIFCSLFLIKDGKIQKIRWLVVTVTFIIASVLLLYLPVFLFNGFNAVSGNSWVAPMAWNDFIAALPAHLLDLNNNFWNNTFFGSWLTLVVVLGCIIIGLNKKELLLTRQWCILFLVCLLVTLVVSSLQRILLFQRVLIYLSIFQYLILAVLIMKISYVLIKNLQARLIMVCCMSLLFIGVNVYAFYRYTSSEQFNLYDSFDATADILYQKEAETIFVNYYEYSLCIRFKYETSGKSVYIDTGEPLPSIQYQFLVIHNSRPIPTRFSGQAYTKIYEDTEVAVYENKAIN